ncbi:MAG: hypothetical protein ABR591_15760 [Candidatus Velthaea sp.]
MTIATIQNPPSSIASADRLMHLANLASGGGCGCGDGKEHNAGQCPMRQPEFPNFFAGQLVQPDDLSAIEKRVFTHEQLRARHTIGWGIACGFRVGLDPAADAGSTLGTAAGVPVKGAHVRIENGYGIDRYGRDVYLADTRTYSLETLFAEREARIKKAMSDPWCAVPGCQPTPPTHFCIAVRYRECPDKMVPSYAQQCGTPKTVCEPSRIREDIEIRIFGDNEFPVTQKGDSSQFQRWCGLPREDLTMAAAFLNMLEIPAGATDVASSATWKAFISLSEHVANSDAAGNLTTEAAFSRQGNCEDLLHLARPCEPCVDWPWIPLACFTRDGDTVSAPDCRVRRTIYSLQELEAIIVRIFCFLYHERATTGATTNFNEMVNLFR